MGPPLFDQKVVPPSAPRSINPSSPDDESLAMGPPLSPERSSSVPFKVKPFLTLSDPDSDCNEIFSESNAIEFVDKHLLTTEEAQLLWESDSLTNFAQVCASVSDDIEFDRLNNKLLVALKLFSSANKIYCVKCKRLTQMTKRGKTKNTYQFACDAVIVASHLMLLNSLRNFLTITRAKLL